MKLYKILVQHFSQKDSHSSTECFLVASSDEEAYLWLNEEQFGLWEDRNEEDGVFDIYDEEYNVIGQETYKEKMLRLKGEYFDKDLELLDLYYGATIYGWEDITSVDLISEVEVLKRLNILKFFNEEKYLLYVKSKNIEKF